MGIEERNSYTFTSENNTLEKSKKTNTALSTLSSHPSRLRYTQKRLSETRKVLTHRPILLQPSSRNPGTTEKHWLLGSLLQTRGQQIDHQGKSSTQSNGRRDSLQPALCVDRRTSTHKANRRKDVSSYPQSQPYTTISQLLTTPLPHQSKDKASARSSITVLPMPHPSMPLSLSCLPALQLPHFKFYQPTTQLVLRSQPRHLLSSNKRRNHSKTLRL